MNLDKTDANLLMKSKELLVISSLIETVDSKIKNYDEEKDFYTSEHFRFVKNFLLGEFLKEARKLELMKKLEE